MSCLPHFRIASCVLLGTLTMTITGCSSSPHASKGPTLEGTPWVLAELPGRALVGENRPTAQFEAGRVHGTDGCNRYSAPVTIRGSSIEIGPRGPSTLMACPPEVMAQADAFKAALSQARRYRIADERLELLGSDDRPLVAFTAISLALEGTAWEVTAINNGRGAVTGLVQGTSVTMEFGGDGRVFGSGGCNQYTGGYEQKGESLRFSTAASTHRMCIDEGLMEQEAAFFKAMQTVTTMRREGDRLEMRTADGALALSMKLRQS